MELILGGLAGLLLFGTLAALANLVGGLLLIKWGAHRFGERFLKYLVALGVGVMLAAVFSQILPETIGVRTASNPGFRAARAVIGAVTLLLGCFRQPHLFGHKI